MTSTTLVSVVVLLLALGITSLVTAIVAGRFSTHGRGRRAAALAVLGSSALVAAVYMLWGEPWSTARDDILWPLTVYCMAAVAGLGLGAGLVYGLVAAR